MADKLSKFNIKGTLADVIDAEARASIAELSEDVAGMASDVSSAVSTAQDAKTTAENAQSAADEKLSPTDAWKIGTVSATRYNLTITPGTAANIQSPAVSGSNVIPLFAYCPDTETQLTCIRLSTDSGAILATMDNIGSSAVSGDITITIVYAYK